MNTHERKLMLDLVSKFCDGSELSRDEISLMQNERVICTEGKGHQYALTEFGRQFMPQSLFYKNRERNLRFKAEDSSQCPDTDDILTNGRPPVDAKAAIWRYVRGLQLTPDQRQVLLADELIEPNQQGGTVITAKGEALLKSTGGTDFVLNSIIGQPKVWEIHPPMLEYAAAQEAQNQQSRSGLDMLIKSGPTLRETDPHGKAQHETGAKLDAGKPRLGLVLGAFANALVEVGKVGTYGAQKYTDNGWLDVPKGKARYTDALLRHVLAETNETHDPDTHLLHAAHAAWNALARLELVLRKRGETE